MMIVPVNWSFQRKSILPIIEAIGKSKVKDSEPILIQNAIEIIKKAEEFNGKPYPCKPNYSTTNSISISLSIIFPTEEDIKNYMEFLQKRK